MKSYLFPSFELDAHGVVAAGDEDEHPVRQIRKFRCPFSSREKCGTLPSSVHIKKYSLSQHPLLRQQHVAGALRNRVAVNEIAFFQTTALTACAEKKVFFPLDIKGALSRFSAFLRSAKTHTCVGAYLKLKDHFC